MSPSLPTFVVGPAGPDLDRTRGTIPDGLEARVCHGVPELLAALPSPEAEGATADGMKGVVVAASGLASGAFEELLRALADRSDSWLLLRVEDRGDRLVARPVSLGFAEELAEVVRRAADPDSDVPVLELRGVLRRVARARHDINNPLTAGMAEAQLALMDLEDPALRESIQLIYDQLIRIKELVADLRALKQAARS